MTRAAITAFDCTPDEAAVLRELAARYDVRATITATAPSVDTAVLASGCRAVSVSHRTALNRPTLRALRRAGVRYVSTRSIGYDHVDVEYAARLGIVVENVVYAPDGVADFTVMLVLMVVRRARSMLRRAEALDYRPPVERGRELRDLTVGVIGTGRIGSAVAGRLQGFGCRVLAYDHRATGTAEPTALDELLRRSDVLTLHTPLDATTRHLLDRGRLARTKPGACVVNTGRGALIDTSALLDALESGRLGGAALDVLEGEDGVFHTDCRERPLPDTWVRLHRLPNVVITPHLAYDTDRALRDTVESSLVGCLAFEEQEASWIG
ncbi:NAD(P)-dependent oxidoreductase [Nocardioides sp. R1-1]|uniref:NAD(P)-dependent oxidoreductase n=1 Tax=Nocardioides sp. R1-1 TaxID=3383502 RepID=UPI0038D0E6FF